MKTLSVSLLFAVSLLLLASCGSNETTGDTTTDTTTEPTENNTTVNVPVETPVDDPNTFNATFVNFEFGDAAHFFFKDESGKEWEFGNSMVTNFQFEVETDDGFGPNPVLLNKMFKIKYETKEQPLYPDGPIGEVKQIIAAELVQ